MAIITPSTYDGNTINNASYKPYLVSDEMNPPEGQPIWGDIDFDYPVFIGNKRTYKDHTLVIDMIGGTTNQARGTLRNQLVQWFNPMSGDEQYLVGEWDASTITTRRIACRPLKPQFTGNIATIKLRSFKPYWEANAEQTVTWNISASSDTQAVVNDGNVRVAPTIKIKGTSVPLNTWRYRRPVMAWNNVRTALANYPLQLTGGTAGWDTAALVANSGTATAVNDAGNITDSDTTITVDDASSFYASGLILIDSEQIYYASKDATNFLGCVRGVGGTTAAAHLDNADVYQSECFADGRDIRVTLDGVEIARWFGAAAGSSKGPNSSDTYVWAVIPTIPAQNALDSAGELVTLGTDLALGVDVTASGAAAGAPGANVVDGSDATYWHAEIGATTGNLVIDLGASKTINRVRLFHPNSDDAAKAFTIQTSPDDVTYTTQVTVTSNAALGQYSNHDFEPVACRYVKVDVTAVQTGGDGLRIGSVNVYYVNHRLQIKYGNCNVTKYVTDDTQKPMFELNTSANDSWDYNDFYDADNPNRAASWEPIDYQGLELQRHYPTSQDGAYAAVAAALGVANHTSTTTQIRDGYQLNQPCGISSVDHQGYTKQNPDYRRWRLLSVPSVGDVVAEYENTDTTLSVWTAYGSVTTTLTQTAIAIIFYHWIKATSDTAMYAEATDVTATIVDEPTVTLGAAEYFPSTQSISCKLSNNTLDQAIYITGEIENNQNMVIDCENFTIEEEDSGQRHPNMVTLADGAVRSRWLELAPGSNTLEYVDTSVVGVTIEIDYRSRWL